jgi:hypothetical protein
VLVEVRGRDALEQAIWARTRRGQARDGAGQSFGPGAAVGGFGGNEALDDAPAEPFPFDGPEAVVVQEVGGAAGHAVSINAYGHHFDGLLQPDDRRDGAAYVVDQHELLARP